MVLEHSPISERQNVAIHDLIVPHDFIVKSTFDEDSVSCGIAVRHDDLTQRRAIVGDRYVRAGYITRNELQDGVYYDKYEDISVPIVAKIGNQPAASLRLIPNIPEFGLPINNEESIQIYPEWQEKISDIPFELSQLAKSLAFYRDPRPTLALIRSYFAYSRYLGENESAAAVDNRVKELMNGPFMSFGLPEVGPSVNYLGSMTTPVYINLEDSIRNTANAGHKELAQFLDTGKAEGYEWYKGM